MYKRFNCFIKRTVCLSLNIKGSYNQFPPKTEEPSLNKHLFDLDYILKYAHKRNGEKLSFDQLPQSDYYCVVVWNDFWQRPSKTLINQTRRLIKKSGETVTTIYINNHNHEIWGAMTQENRQKLVNYLENKNKN